VEDRMSHSTLLKLLMDITSTCSRNIPLNFRKVGAFRRKKFSITITMT